MGEALKYVRFRFWTKYLKTGQSEAVNFLEELTSGLLTRSYLTAIVNLEWELKNSV